MQWEDVMADGAREFLAARDFLLAHREDYAAACRNFRWPSPSHFNWALDYFDPMAAGNSRRALWIVNEDGAEFSATFAEMKVRSDRAANFLRAQGVRRGDRILLMLGNVPALWDIMLAAMKLGAVLIPSTTLLARGGRRSRPSLRRATAANSFRTWVLTTPPAAISFSARSAFARSPDNR